MLKGFSKWVIRKRRYVFIATAVLTLVFGAFIGNIRVNPDFTSYLPKSDPVIQLFDQIGEDYGGNLLALVALEAEDIFDAAVIRNINDITAALKTVEGVSYVTSLTNILDIRSSQDGIEISRLINEYDLPETARELADLKEYTLTKEMYRGRIISEDATATLIICRLRPDGNEVAIANNIKTAVGQKATAGRVYFGGMPFMMRDVNDMIVGDVKLLLPLVALVTIAILFLSFRSTSGVFLPLIAVALAIIWTIGLMCALGVPVSLLSNIIPVVLFAVGSAYSIHVVSKFNEAPPFPNERGDSLSAVVLPVMLAALTTMVGFLSFVFGSYLTTIREFGIFATAGVIFSCVISLTLVPALASRTGTSRQQVHPRQGERMGIFPRIADAPLKRPFLVLGLTFIFIVVAIIGVPRLERNADILDYFKPGTDIRQAENFMQRKFGGTMPVQIMVKGDILEPEILRAIKKLQNFLEAHEDITHAQSIVDLIEEMSFVIGEGRQIPDHREKVANLWFLLEGEETVTQMVNPQLNEGVIQATVRSAMQTARVRSLVDSINAYITRNNNERYSFEQTGMPSIHYRLDESINQSLVYSIALATIAIFITVSLLLRSVRGGLIGVVPVALSLLGIFGFMGIARIPLDIATVLVGGVSIGIGIDYSIHFLSRFKRERARRRDTREALRQTLATTGRAILVNVIAVTAGFLVLLGASLIPLQRFGILIAITMLASGYGALAVLPALIIVTRAKFQAEKADLSETINKRSAK